MALEHNNCIMTQTLLQLSMPKVKKMSLLLNKTQSSYYPAFKSMLDSIDTGANTFHSNVL